VTEATDVRTDFGEDHLRSDSAYAWNIGEIYSCNPIQLAAEVERRIIALTPVSGAA